MEIETEWESQKVIQTTQKECSHVSDGKIDKPADVEQYEPPKHYTGNNSVGSDMIQQGLGQSHINKSQSYNSGRGKNMGRV